MTTTATYTQSERAATVREPVCSVRTSRDRDHMGVPICRDKRVVWKTANEPSKSIGIGEQPAQQNPSQFAPLLPQTRSNKERLFLSLSPSPLGQILAAATSQGVCLLQFTDPQTLHPQLAALKKFVGDAPLVPEPNEHLHALHAQLAAYFAHALQNFSVPLAYPGTPFQRRLWNQLLAIPFGQTRSYQQLAAAVGNPKASRAVGHANALNPLPILIPCHRVINKSGSLGGYSSGLHRKKFLLTLEQHDAL